MVKKGIDMNLLTDSWIPIQHDSAFKLITLQTLLCKTDVGEIALSRDDMELACLQLIICLTQVLFLPNNDKMLRQRIIAPLSKEDYQAGIQGYTDWFDLNHPDTPFMQIRGVKAAKVTPIQKLFIGLPEGNNHAFFNNAGDISAISASAAAIVLFNQAMNSPSFGGGFKGGFRGGAPITTLLKGDSLRQTIWFNILHKASVNQLLAGDYDSLKATDKPVWVEPIKAKSTIEAAKIGLLRGLFWQPAHIELIVNNQNEQNAPPKYCEFYGIETDHAVVSFNKEKFVYTLIGDWIHPHSPRIIDLKKKTQRYRSFTTSAPAWTQLNHFVIQSESKKEDYRIATVVKQFSALTAGAKDINPQLIVGGYRNKQASILQRRHELFPLNTGWDDNSHYLESLVIQAVEIKQQLRNKLYGFAKASGAEGIPDQAEALFYHHSETLIHEALRTMDWRQSAAMIKQLQQQLIRLSWQIVTEVTQPYQHEAKMIKALVITKKTLSVAFKKITGEKQ